MADPSTVAPYGTPLSVSELLVLMVMRDADSEADAARRLGLSKHTVRGHLANARSRLGVKTTRQAIARVFA